MPGDQILFRRGDIWDEGLVISNAGTASQKILYGAYGVGTAPTIDSDFQSGGILCYKSYITIQDFIVKNTSNNAVSSAVTGGCYDMLFQRLEIHNSGNNALAISKGGDGVMIDNVKVYNAGNNGIYMSGSAENKLSNVIVQNCYVSGTGGNDGIVVHEDGDNNSAGDNFIIRNNYSELCAEQGFDITTGNNIHLYNNISKNNQQGGVVVGHTANNVTIERHRSIDEPTQATSAAINLGGNSATNSKLIYSIITGNGYHLFRVTQGHVEAYNNIFVYDGGGSIMDFSGEVESLEFKNNIVTTKLEGMGRIRFLSPNRPPDFAGFTFDNNLYYSPNGIVTIYDANSTSNYSLANYQSAFSQDANSSLANPLFIDLQGEDFHLLTGSPAIDSGQDVGYGIDYDENTVPVGSAPDKGPFEFGNPSPTLNLSLKSFLQGAYNQDEQLMTDLLRQNNHIPLTEPYTAIGYDIVEGGGESTTNTVLNVTGNDAVVDWVFVEIHNPNNSNAIIETRAALIQRDGDIVDVDGISPLTFEGINIYEIYIVIKHRNHFGVRSIDIPILFDDLTLDFTDPTVNIFGFNPMNNISGVRVMVSGEANGDGQINFIDIANNWRIQNAVSYLYHSSFADFNLDGTVNSFDRNFYWRINNTRVQEID